MKPWFRIAMYIGGGGLLVTLADPPGGFAQFALVLLVIVGAAYTDHWLTRKRPQNWMGGNVISMDSVRQSRRKRHASQAAVREKRVFQPVYSSAFHQEVQELLDLLRSEGLNPVMVSQRPSRGESSPIYEVRLPAKEVSKAKPLVQFFQVKSAKTPS
jgi:hypothetical protein